MITARLDYAHVIYMVLEDAAKKSLRNIFSRDHRASALADGSSEVRDKVADGAALNLPERFVMRRKLGEGGMGVVYRVHDSDLGQDVALKSLHQIDPDGVFTLKNEFRALRDIHHPNLVCLHELHVVPGACFFTMELVYGVDLLTYVQRAPLSGRRDVDWERFEGVAYQLAQGIRAIHTADKLHRDIKPSNVMVTDAGRVVLLDFGLVAAIGLRVDDGLQGFAGTPDYMSPEQITGQPLGVASDWYSFGVTLYEAATGRFPHESRLSMLSRRSRLRPIHELVPGAPPHLDELVLPFLEADPERRANAEHVLSTKAPPIPPPIMRSSPPSGDARSRFHGRVSELSTLAGALDTALEGTPVAVHLHGLSGMGKTELARHFTDEAERKGALVLRGRCHPRESVAFNALDGVADALSQFLRQLPIDELYPLLPQDSDLLPSLFPVLGRVPTLGDEAPASEPRGALLERGGRALRTLLERLSRRRPTILWLDDVQWGDDDSGRLLRALMRPPDAPMVLLLLTYRTEGRESSRMLSVLGSGDAEVARIEMPLGPLAESDVIAIVEGVLKWRAYSASTELLDRMAREAEGVPFFARELAQYVADLGASPIIDVGLVRFEDALESRIRALPPKARDLLEVLALAGGPLLQRHALAAAGLPGSARTILSTLETDSFVRSAAVDAARSAEIYHHRIRDAIIRLVNPATQRSRHFEIGTAMLSAEAPNLAQVVEHFNAAERTDAVRRYVVAAARQAENTFAFDRAAGLYELAIEVRATDLAPVELEQALAEALANAGRGKEAGAVFERAATLAEREGTLGVSPTQLRSLAAEQYLRSWQRDDARRMLASLAGPLGIELPTSTGEALLETVVNRTRIAVKGFHGVLQETEPPAEVTQRLSVLVVLMQILGLTEPVYSLVCSSRLLLEALAVENREWVIRGLLCESISWGTFKWKFAQRRTTTHVQVLERILTPADRPYHRAVLAMSKGTTAQLKGHYAVAVAHFQESMRILRQVRTGVTAEWASITSFYLTALGHLGRLEEQRRSLDDGLLAAELRGDDYFIATCAVGHSNLAWILGDRGGEVLKWVERVRSLAPTTGFTSQEYSLIAAMVQLRLYEGRGRDAYDYIESKWKAAQHAGFFFISLVGDDLHQLRGRAALAAAAELHGRDPSSRRSLLGVARREARAIRAGTLPFASGHADLLDAGAFALSGDHRRATRALEQAATNLRESGLSLYEASARVALGNLEPTHRKQSVEAEAWMSSVGVVDSIRAARMFVPGCL